MTHDELLKIIDIETENDAGYLLGPILRYVVELHSSTETLEDEVGKKYEVSWCQICDEYPCPTIQVIEKELSNG